MVDTLTTPADPWSEVTRDTRFSETGTDRLARFGGDTSAMATSYLELESKMGSMVKMPTEHSTPEERSNFYRATGCPEAPEGYEIVRPELPEGMTYDEQFEMTMRGIAHEAGFSQAQMAPLVDAFNKYQVEKFGHMNDEAAKLTEQQDIALKTKWGGDYKKNVEVVERAVSELISDDALRGEFAMLIEQKGLKNHPVFVEAFNTIGTKMLDDTLVKGEIPKSPDGYTPEYPDSPEMYATADGEGGEKARAWFVTNKGYKY